MNAWIELPDGTTQNIGGHTPIGRQAANAVVLDDEMVSRFHAVILEAGPSEFWLCDGGGLNGTLVNGQLIQKPTLLKEGDIIGIAQHTLAFHLREQAGDVEPRPANTTIKAQFEQAASWDQPFVAAGYGVVILDPAGKPESIPPYVRNWINYFFEDAPDSKDELPESLEHWLAMPPAERRLQPDSGGREDATTRNVSESRLLVLLQPDMPSKGRAILLFSEMEPLLASPRMRRLFKFTPTECKVMQWAAQGKTNKEIAEVMESKDRTIERHLGNIFAKLGVENRSTAIAMVTDKLREDSR